MKLIPLTQGKFAQVDDEDYDFLMQWKWQTKKDSHTYYASRYRNITRTNRVLILMHRELLGLKKGDGKFGDHKDRNGLNNQRGNIRIATKSENMRNKQGYGVSNYRGVSLNVYNNKNRVYIKWIATIKNSGKQKTLGRFNTEIEAALAYNKVAKELYGEFANLNII